MELFDPVTGEKLDLYCSIGESDEKYFITESKVDEVIKKLADHHGVEEYEVVKKIENSDVYHPVELRDQVYWVE